ncbi:MAG TPA: hypothetical protein PLD23_05350 [Armatimonadota bacterium]|nr:hypothetical protein [Armatimonadota bacterium]
MAEEPPVDDARPYRSATVRAVLVAVFLSLAVTAWNRQSELVTLISQVSESTPPIASILSLLLLLGVGGLATQFAQWCEARGVFLGLARRCRRLVLSRGELLVVFVFVAITAAMPGVGLFRQVMPCLMVPSYFGTPSDHLAEMARAIPPAWAVTDPEAARVFWEGGDRDVPAFGLSAVPLVGGLLEGAVRFLAGPSIVPWRYWRVPFAFWSCYLFAYFAAAFCLVTLFRRAWEDDERLGFPVANLPVEMIRSGSGLSDHAGFFRDPVVWVGLSLAAIYNGMNVLHVFQPNVPALMIHFPLGSLFTEAPWDAMQGLAIFYKPEILGLGYLVPSDVLFSIWFFTLVSWLACPVAKVAGYSPPGFPFRTRQSMGAFVVLGFYFVYQARRQLTAAVRQALTSGRGPDESEEPLTSRAALLGALSGMAIVITMPIVAGVAWWVSLMYFGLMFVVLLVYCRNRAEMGFPIVWGYPLYQQRQSMVDFLGSAAFVSPGRTRSFTLLTMFSWLQRSVNQAITSTGQEAYVAADRLGLGRRTATGVVMAALAFGIVTAFLANLSAYYEYGGLVLSSSGGIEGGQMTQEVLGQFTMVSRWIDEPVPPHREYIGFTVGGAVLALGMILGRRTWLRFPFHPAGYALAFSHDGSYMWFPALLLWAMKGITVRLGGVRLYRRLSRGFLAFTLGHFLSVGVWSLAGLHAPEWVRQYIVWFL